MSSKVENDQYYGFDTVKLNQMFEGGLTYCNTFCIKGEYAPVAVYSCASPNRAKGHKDYVLLCREMDPLTGKYHGGIIRGMDKDEMQQWRFQDGIRCVKCESVVFSITRHDFHHCECKAVAIDGGREYTRIVGNPEDYERVTIDLINHEVTAKELG